MAFETITAEKEEKAGYNQSKNITEILGNLLGAYVYHINKGELKEAVKVMRRMHDIISAKIKEHESEEVDRMVVEIELILPEAVATFNHDGKNWVRNPQLKTQAEHSIEKLFRYINKLQDKYGYGMVSLDDPRFAVLQH